MINVNYIQYPGRCASLRRMGESDFELEEYEPGGLG